LALSFLLTQQVLQRDGPAGVAKDFRMLNWIETITDAILSVVQIICNSLLAIMAAVIIMMVFTRNFLGFSFPWTEELTRYLLVWVSLLGAAVLLRLEDHIQIDFLKYVLGPRAETARRIFIHVLVGAFMAFLCYEGWLTAMSRGAARSPALGVSLTWPYLAVVVSSFMMAVISVIGICRQVPVLISGAANEDVIR
jgi:TRAP-type C4-dicarboxylate transport system permease small subunit